MDNNVVIIEDDRDIASLVELHLRDMGCAVRVAHDGRSGLDTALKGPTDLVILDLMIPEMDGLEVCRQLRSESPYTPILMLTAKSTELDRVVGLEMGADDYLTKPFSIRELVARVKAMFRRVEALRKGKTVQKNKIIQCGDIRVDIEKRMVTVKGKKIELTAKEFDLLLQFAENPGRVYTRAQLLDSVWGYGHEGYEHTVNSHMNRLRAKIEDDPARPRYILTVWGVGYKFNDPTTEEGN